jgi:prophage regulatory protein
MSAQFLMESDIAKCTQIKPRSGKEFSNSPEEIIFVRLPEVKAVTGLSKSSLYALIRASNFPAPVRLGPRTVGWVRSEVKQWAAECPYIKIDYFTSGKQTDAAARSSGNLAGVKEMGLDY